MLHTKFNGNLSTCSGGEDFEGFLSYTGVATTLSRSWDFHFHVPESLQTKFG